MMTIRNKGDFNTGGRNPEELAEVLKSNPCSGDAYHYRLQTQGFQGEPAKSEITDP